MLVLRLLRCIFMLGAGQQNRSKMLPGVISSKGSQQPVTHLLQVPRLSCNVPLTCLLCVKWTSVDYPGSKCNDGKTILSQFPAVQAQRPQTPENHIIFIFTVGRSPWTKYIFCGAFLCCLMQQCRSQRSLRIALKGFDFLTCKLFCSQIHSCVQTSMLSDSDIQ